MSQDNLNSIVNGYTILGQLGKGSQAKVYKAAKYGKTYAIKVFLKSNLDCPVRNTKKSLRNLLDSEIKVMKLIESDYVIKLIEVFETPFKVYLVL